MKRSKLTLTIGFCLSLLTFGFSQQAHKEKAAILQTALEEVFLAGNPDPSLLQLDQRYAQGAYLEEYGIILKAPTYHMRSFVINQDSLSFDSLNRRLEQTVTHLMIRFLEDYGMLASSLSPQEKVLVYYDNSNLKGGFKSFYLKGKKAFMQDTDQAKQQDFESITAEVSKSDIDSHSSGLKNFIKISIRHKESDQLAYQVLSKIWLQLISDSENQFQYSILDTRFDKEDAIDYQILDGFGVLYNISLASPFFKKNFSRQKSILQAARKDADLPNGRMGTTGESVWEQHLDKNMLRNDSTADSAYISFEKKWREYIIEYGRTLKGLSPNERLVLNIELPSCFTCQMPARVRLIAEKNLLDQYAQGELSLAQAARKVKVIKLGKALES